MHSMVDTLWDEWVSYVPEGGEALEAEIAGLISGLRRSLCGDEVVLSSTRLAVVHRLARLWKESVWEGEWNITARMQVAAKKRRRVHLALPLAVYEAAANGGDADSWSWVRGVWGGCGALYVPRSGYYLVMRMTEEVFGAKLEQILKKSRISSKRRVVHGTHEIILRDQQEILAFLSKMGLPGISLRIEETAILRSMRDRANRISNCDTANIKKSLKVAEGHMELVSRLRQSGLLQELPPSLLALVEARTEHPEASLSELGDIMTPPVTKSTVKYRWKRLEGFLER